MSTNDELSTISHERAPLPASSEQATLSPGDVLRIGDVALLFHRLPGAGPALQHPRFIGISVAMGHVVRAIGLIETASGGSLFLDEIIDAPPSLQASLLRVFDASRPRRQHPRHRQGLRGPAQDDVRLAHARGRS